MTAQSNDGDLALSFAREGSESAFRALVARHVDLVFATALRQTGDHGVAEEITQNVFIALARKAPRLAGRETVAGWLHRTAVLEARARVRSELRRRYREHTAADLAALRNEGISPLDAAVPLLDEALLHLGEPDRLALISRFFEQRSLREVGDQLGLKEDAARKRVSRALDRLAVFFKKRGFALPEAGGAAALFAPAAKAAPAGLAAACVNAGVSAGTAVHALHPILYHFMSLSKSSTAVICVLFIAAPLTWRHSVRSELARKQASLDATLQARLAELQELSDERTRAETSFTRASLERKQAEASLASLRRERETASSPARYRWDDASPVVRVPKQFLKAIPMSAVTNRIGALNPGIEEVLQIRRDEAQQIQAALENFLSNVRAAEQSQMRPVQPESRDLNGHKPEETLVFEIGDVSDRIREFRANLFAYLEAILGPERFPLFRDALSDWMPVDEVNGGINSGMAIFEGQHRISFYKPPQGEDRMWFGIVTRGSSLYATLPIEQIEPNYLPFLKDWVQIAQSNPPPGPSQGLERD